MLEETPRRETLAFLGVSIPDEERKRTSPKKDSIDLPVGNDLPPMHGPWRRFPIRWTFNVAGKRQLAGYVFSSSKNPAMHG
jgi:hypothetical protein